MYLFSRRTTTKKKKEAKEAFLNIDEKLDKLMQPNEKIHLYKEDDLIGYLGECFDLMISIESEMTELSKIPDTYPNFKEKCNEFGTLCEGISDLVDIAIENLQHFSSFKRLSSLKEERAKAETFLRSFSISDKVDGMLEVRRDLASCGDLGSYQLTYEPQDLILKPEEIEKARKEGIFRGLSIEDDISDNQEKDEAEMIEESKEEQSEILKKSSKANLNALVMKRMEILMTKAKNRNPMTGRKHEKRVQEIRDGKFKICIPAVTLVFKYLVKMFIIIRE